MGDWIKLHRKIIECPVFANANILKVWLWCLCKASYKERDVLVGNQIIHLQKGQFVYGRLSAAMELNIKDRTVYDYMGVLKNLDMLRIDSNNKFSVVTIVKWGEYQFDDDDFQQQTNINPTTNQQQTNINPTTNQQQTNTNNKVNKDNNIKKDNNNIIGQNEIDDFFDSVWNLYPKKLGKGKVSATKRKKLYDIGYDKIAKCIELFIDDNKGKDEQFIPHGSTFFNSGYVDYLERVENTKEENNGWYGYPEGYWQSVDD